MGRFAKYRGVGSTGGIRVFDMCTGSSLWGSNLEKYGERKLWSYFLLHSPLVDDLEGILSLCTKELGSVQEISLHYISIAQYSEQCLPGQRSLRPLCSPSSDVS